MFRNEILEALKAKFQGVSEKILGRIADTTFYYTVIF